MTELKLNRALSPDARGVGAGGMSIIRRMEKEDADMVRQVDAIAFSAWVEQAKGEEAELPLRTRTNVLACQEKDPQGCFVAQENGRLVGFIFSRTWGGVGWFGAFAVLPEYQGRGIGKRLTAASLDYLQQEPSRVIGLETMPESHYNLGLYLKLGFQTRLPTILMGKALKPSGRSDIDLPCWLEADAATRGHWLTELREATGRICPGLDYSKEIISTAQYGLGKTLVLIKDARAVGMSVVGLVSSREKGGAERAVVSVLAVHPDYTDDDTFRALLDATEALARAHDKRKVAMVVNSRHTWTLERLLRWGYRVERMAVHMVLKGTDNGPSTDDWVDLSRWAG